MIILDIEASGLAADSYPIEMAWTDMDSGEQDQFLINPDSARASWTYWDEYAEALHGISRSHGY